jgi:hypothetical protein
MPNLHVCSHRRPGWLQWIKVFWFFFSKKNRFAVVFKKEPLRYGFQKRTASLWFPKKNRSLRFSKNTLPSFVLRSRHIIRNILSGNLAHGRLHSRARRARA